MTDDFCQSRCLHHCFVFLEPCTLEFKFFFLTLGRSTVPKSSCRPPELADLGQVSFPADHIDQRRLVAEQRWYAASPLLHMAGHQPLRQTFRLDVLVHHGLTRAHLCFHFWAGTDHAQMNFLQSVTTCANTYPQCGQASHISDKLGLVIFLY